METILDCPIVISCQRCRETAEAMGGFAAKGEVEIATPLGWQQKLVRNSETSPPLYDHVFHCPKHREPA